MYMTRYKNGSGKREGWRRRQTGDETVCLWRRDELCVRYYGNHGEHIHDYAMQSRRRREQGNVLCDVRRRRGRPKGTENDDRVGAGEPDGDT